LIRIYPDFFVLIRVLLPFLGLTMQKLFQLHDYFRITQDFQANPGNREAKKLFFLVPARPS
jgi:hypothetical protein